MTFSLAARDPATGAFGMVLSSSSPAVAARCLHLRPRVGVAASQNVTNPALGPRLLLERMGAGHPARRQDGGRDAVEREEGGPLVDLADAAPPLVIADRPLAVGQVLGDPPGEDGLEQGGGACARFPTGQHTKRYDVETDASIGARVIFLTGKTA